MVLVGSSDWIPVRLNILSDTMTMKLASIMRVRRREAWSYVQTLISWGCDQRQPVLDADTFDHAGLADLVDYGEPDAKLDLLRKGLVTSGFMTKTREGYEIYGVRQWIERLDKKQVDGRRRVAEHRERKRAGDGSMDVTRLDKKRLEEKRKEETRAEQTRVGSDLSGLQAEPGVAGSPAAAPQPSKPRQPAVSTDVAIQEGRIEAMVSAQTHADRETVLAQYDNGDVNHVGLFIHLVNYLGGVPYTISPPDAKRIREATLSGIHPRDLADAYLNMHEGKLGAWVMDHLDVDMAVKKFSNWQAWRQKNGNGSAHGRSLRRTGAQMAGELPQASGPVRPGVSGADRYASNAQAGRDRIAAVSEDDIAELFGDEGGGAPEASGGGEGSRGAQLDPVPPERAPEGARDGEPGARRARRPRTWGGEASGVGAPAF